MTRVYVILGGLSLLCIGIGLLIVWPELASFRVRRRAGRRKGWIR